MAPTTRSSQKFVVKRVVNPTLQDLLKELKMKYRFVFKISVFLRLVFCRFLFKLVHFLFISNSKLKRAKKATAKKMAHFKLRKTKLKNAADRVLRPPIVPPPIDAARLFRETAQNLQPSEHRVLAVPVPVVDAQAAFIASLREAAQNLRPVDGYRVENGVIVID